MVKSLNPNEYNVFYGTYITKVTNPNVVAGLEESKKEFMAFMTTLPSGKLKYAYAAGKWTINEVIQHVLDTERIFNYRALRFARNDKTELPGFEQDDFVPFSGGSERSKEELINDYVAVRNASISLFRSFSTSMLQYMGNASGSPMSTRAAGFIIVGHQKHHLEVIRQRYLTHNP